MTSRFPTCAQTNQSIIPDNLFASEKIILNHRLLRSRHLSLFFSDSLISPVACVQIVLNPTLNTTTPPPPSLYI